MQHPSETPKGLNLFDFLALVTSSKAMTANLKEIIQSMSGLFALAVGSVSAIGIVTLHYRVAGSVGLATAAIAGIISLVAKIRRRGKRARGS